MGQSEIYVGILEDDINYSNTLAKIIDKQENMHLSFTCARGEHLLDLLESHHTDILIMDIRLPDIKGSEYVQKVVDRFPNLKCLMCTTFMDSDLIVESLRNGAAGYILKTDSAENIISAVSDVNQGAAYMSKHVSLKLVEYFHKEEQNRTKMLDTLSERENQVLRLLNEGKLYKEVAEILEVSLDTIKKHTSNIYKKLDVQNKTEALNKYNNL